MVCDIAGVVIGEFLWNLNTDNIVLLLIPFKFIHIEMYSPVLGQSPLIDSLFLRLRKKVAAELRFQKELVKAKGALDMVFASAALAATATAT